MDEYIKKNDIVLNYRGLAKINPYDFVGIAKYFTDQINEMPAADVAPVRHGRWMRENNRVKSYIRICSECRKIAYFCGTGCSYKYCPNCGAIMDGGQNNEC